VANPELTPDQKAALDQRWQQLMNDPRYNDLAADGDHGGHITQNSSGEALIGLDLNQQGIGPFADKPGGDPGNGVGRPTGVGGGDLVDGNGRPWDIKSMHSDWPPGADPGNGRPYPEAFTENKFIDKVNGQLDRGCNVIIDTRNTSQVDIDSMNRIVNEKGWNGKLIFYP
jgi:hypothetical protein